ncbi:MAG: hypothetical protein V2A54_15635, partial [Bacteroidota bacterium]
IYTANKGKKVKLSYYVSGSTTRDISGIIADYLKISGVIKIKGSDGKTTYINSGNVVETSFEDNPAEALMGDSITRLNTITFSKNNGEVALKELYMHTGMQWIPSYNIKILNDKELQREMKAVVENYSEDINETELILCVGNPQFYFGTTPDPIATNYLSSVAYSTPVSAAFGLTNSNVYQVQAYDAVPREQEKRYDFNMHENFNTEGEKTNDIFMYKLGKATLKKNSKTSFSVFSASVPYKDVYEVTIGDVVNYYYNRYISNDPEERFTVYHSLKITNTTSNPFTTAPIFVLDESLQPLAQDRLKYTPLQADAMVQLSKAGDVYVKNSEEEVTKIEAYKKVGRTIYNKVTVKGQITLENLQNKKINLNITKSLVADVTSVSDNGKFKKSGKYYSYNPYTEIKWEVPMNAGEKKTVTYQYDVLVTN